MGQRLDINTVQGRFLSLVGNTVSGKGVLMQAIACQIALPAMAQPSLGIASEPPPLTSDDIASQSPDGDVFHPPTAIPLEGSSSAPQPFDPTAALQPSPELPAAPATSLIPQSQSTSEQTASYSLSPVASTSVEFSPHELQIEAAIGPVNEPVVDLTADPEEVVESEIVESEIVDSEVVEPEIVELEIVESSSEFSWFALGETKDKGYNSLYALTLPSLQDTALQESAPILLAGPQDLNPSLSRPPVSLPSVPTHSPAIQDNVPNNEPSNPPLAAPPVSDLENQNQLPLIQWTDLEIGFDSESEGSGPDAQSRWSILPEVRGQLANGNAVGISAGFSRFDQANVETVEHSPITFSWQGNLDPIDLEISGGVDLFNRLPIDTHFSARTAIPIGQKARLSMSVEQAPYAFNATTLENNISAWHYGPDVFWQITPNTSLFSEVRLGNYSDGNWAQQSFSRLERQVGDGASVALNFFNQSFQQNLEASSGYFSPQDFLVATAEMSWQENLAESLSCGLLGSIGQQRLAGEWALAYSAQALCRVDITPSIQLDLGYQLSNVSKNQSAFVDDNAYTHQQIMGGISIRF